MNGLNTADVIGYVLLAILVIVVIVILVRAVRIVPQAKAFIVERLGRYSRTLDAGLHLLIPFFDRVRAGVDLREQVVSFPPQPVITSDNLVVSIDTVIYYQVTEPRSAVYEIANYIQGIEQLTVTTLRNVVGSMDLEQTLTSRDQINGQLRGVLDEATGRWGVRVNRVELKSIDPPASIQGSMEQQMRAERDRRAAILTAEGVKQSAILTAEGEKQSAILRAEGSAQAADPERRGRVARDPPGVRRHPPRRRRPEAAGLPVPAGAPRDRPDAVQQDLVRADRVHRGARGDLPRLRRRSGAGGVRRVRARPARPGRRRCRPTTSARARWATRRTRCPQARAESAAATEDATRSGTLSGRRFDPDVEAGQHADEPRGPQD